MKTGLFEPRWSRHLATALTALVALLLALDAGLKLLGAPPAIDATGELGFPASATRMLGLVLGGATLLYVVPVTRVLGAILLTGYLGGAVAIHAVHASPLTTHVLSGVYVGIAVWASIWLRNDGLRQFLPIQRGATR